MEDYGSFDGWLDKWKLNHGIQEKQIPGESLGLLETTAESWIERIKELCFGCDCQNIWCQNIWNMDESGCFFKALQTKGVTKK